MIYDITDLDEYIRSYIIDRVKDKFPFDITQNTAFSELFIEPMVEVLRPFIERLNRIEMKQNLANAARMTEEEMDEQGEGNYFMPRKQGERASTMLTLMFANLNLSDPNFHLRVPEGAIFQTSTELSYQTIVETVLTADDLRKGYNKSKMIYEIDVEIESIDLGERFNVSSGEIVIPVTQFSPSLLGSTNKTPLTNGRDKESNEDYAKRLRDWYMSRQLGTKPGYKTFLMESFPEINDVFVVGYKDEFMERDKITVMQGGTQKEIHYGGKVDIYIRGVKFENTTADVTAKTNLLILNVKYDRLGNTARFKIYNLTDETKRPVIKSITSVTDNEYPGGLYLDMAKIIMDNRNNISYDPTIVNDMKLVYDYYNENGELQKDQMYFEVGVTETAVSSPVSSVNGIEVSSLGYLENIGDKYDLLLTGIPKTTQEEAMVRFKNLTNVPNGSRVSLEYIVNETLRTCKIIFDEFDENRIVTTDMLVRDAIPKYVNIQFRVKLDLGRSMYDVQDIRSRLQTSVSNFFKTYMMGDDVEASDIVNWVYQDDSVNKYIRYIALPFDVFYLPKDPNENIPTDGSQQAPDGVLPIRSIEYPILNAPKFEISII